MRWYSSMKKLLVVDNSSYMRIFVKKIVQKGGAFSVFEASDKEDAIEVFNLIKPDVVFLDLNMSETTMDGIDALTYMVKANPETSVIIMSAVGHQEVKDKCIEIGAKDYINKPIEAAALLKTLEGYK